MLREKKDNSDYEIDRELTWKLAIESNAELQDRVEELEEENKKLKAAATMYRNDCKKLRAENEYLHKLLPEADWYIIEKQLEKRVRNDGEEDVY